MKPTPINLKQQQGVMLLEALIAILIFSLGILAIVALQGAMIRHTTDSKYRLDASYLANQVIGQMWVANKPSLESDFKTGGTKFTEWKNNLVKTSLPSGNADIAFTGTRVTVTVTWQTPGSPVHNYVAITDINVN